MAVTVYMICGRFFVEKNRRNKFRRLNFRFRTNKWSYCVYFLQKPSVIIFRSPEKHFGFLGKRSNPKIVGYSMRCIADNGRCRDCVRQTTLLLKPRKIIIFLSAFVLSNNHGFYEFIYRFLRRKEV